MDERFLYWRGRREERINWIWGGEEKAVTT